MAKELVQLSRDVRAIVRVLTAVLPMTADFAKNSDYARIQPSGSDAGHCSSVSAAAAATTNPFYATVASSGGVARAEAQTPSHRRDAELPQKMRLPTSHRVNFCQNIQSAPSSAGLPPVLESLACRSQSCDTVPSVDAARRLQSSGGGPSSSTPGKLRAYRTGSVEGGSQRRIEELDSSDRGLVDGLDCKRRQWEERRQEERTDLASYSVAQCDLSNTGRLLVDKSGGLMNDVFAKSSAPGDSGIDMGRDIDHSSGSTLLTTDL